MGLKREAGFCCFVPVTIPSGRSGGWWINLSSQETTCLVWTEPLRPSSQPGSHVRDFLSLLLPCRLPEDLQSKGGGMVWSWEWGTRISMFHVGAPKELEVVCIEMGLPGWAVGRGSLDRGIPFGHTVYKPSTMSVCVSLKGKV